MKSQKEQWAEQMLDKPYTADADISHITELESHGQMEYFNMTDHQKIKALMKEIGLNYFDIAKITGLTYNTVKTSLQPNREVPRWVKLVLYVWEKGVLIETIEQ